MSSNLRFFGLFDVLGFSNYCENHTTEKLIEGYRGLFGEVGHSTSYATEETDHLLIFSDSVCFAEPKLETRQEAVRHLFRMASLLMHNSIFSKETDPIPPFRGCVSFGEYVFHKSVRLFGNSDVGNPVVIGKAVARASAWERKQKWVGASVVPSDIPAIRENFPDLLQQLTEEGYLVEYDVPTDEGLVATFAINFVTSGHRDSIHKQVLEMEKKLPPEQACKYLGTRRFVERLISQGKFVPPR